MRRLVLTLSIGLLAAACRAATSASESASAPAVGAAEHTGPTTAPLEPASLGSIRRLHALGGVLAASQPAALDLEQAQEGGVRTVVNLRHESEVTDFDEPALVRSLGLTYVSIPWSGVDELTDEVFDRAREVLQTAERPLLVHCHSANRVGAVWLPWRVLDGGLSWDAALAEAEQVGLRTPALVDRARDYVLRHGGAH